MVDTACDELSLVEADPADSCCYWHL